MNSDEWDEITVAILACWPNKEIPERSFDLWFRDLSEFEAEQVEAAVLALYRDGREWAPNGAQIRNKLIEAYREPNEQLYELLGTTYDWLR